LRRKSRPHSCRMVATVLLKLSFVVLASLRSSKGYHAAFSRGYRSSLFAPRRAAIGTLDITEADNYYLSRSITQLGLPNMDYHLASIDLSFPGIRVINSNPPVFEITFSLLKNVLISLSGLRILNLLVAWEQVKLSLDHVLFRVEPALLAICQSTQ
jgi:hypothetical protein